MGRHHHHHHGHETAGPTHYKGQDAMGHVVETQAEGKLSAVEIHGTEMPGHLSAACDAARETALILLLIAFMLLKFDLPLLNIMITMGIFATGWLVWKVGRSAWLGWQRLERFHRIIAEERWEIEHHREQERDELYALYAAKGFEGELLDDVVEVLMADGDRLLRVMVEEELNLSLEKQEHPLKQALGAGIGVLAASLFCIPMLLVYPLYGIAAAALLVMGISGAASAYYQRNRRVPAFVWNVGIGLLSLTCAYSLWNWIT